MNLNLNSVHLFVTESKQALNIGTWAPFAPLLNTGHKIQPTPFAGAYALCCADNYVFQAEVFGSTVAAELEDVLLSRLSSSLRSFILMLPNV